MKIERAQTVPVSDVATDRKLRLDALFSIFQEMAVWHTQRVGLSLHELLESGRTWVLSRAVVRIDELPLLDETITVTTWSRGVRRFKGFREFVIERHGRPVIAASTLWVYLDTRKGRPTRVPDSYEARYGLVPDRAVDGAIEELLFPAPDRPDYQLTVATRISDYDVNGHVNNAVILQYLETAIYRYHGPKTTVAGISLAFQREIPLSVRDVTVAVQQTPEGCRFAIGAGEDRFVIGSVALHAAVSHDNRPRYG